MTQIRNLGSSFSKGCGVLVEVIDRMESFWKSALEAAEKAKTVAKTVSQKGIVRTLVLVGHMIFS